MNRIALVIGFFITGTSFTQTNFNTDSLAIEVCDCIDSSSRQSNVKDEFFSECFEHHFSRINVPNLLDTTNTEISPYEQGRLFGDSIGGLLMNIIIDDCDVWASYMYDLREAGIKKMVDKSQKKQIALAKKEISQNNSEQNQVELGICYLKDGNMEKAKEQLDFCLVEYPNSIAVSLFGALYFELNDEVEKALLVYEMVYEAYPEYSIYSIMALLKRKIRLRDR